MTTITARLVVDLDDDGPRATLVTDREGDTAEISIRRVRGQDWSAPWVMRTDGLVSGFVDRFEEGLEVALFQLRCDIARAAEREDAVGRGA